MPIELYDWEIDSYGFCRDKNHSIRNAFRISLSDKSLVFMGSYLNFTPML